MNHTDLCVWLGKEGDESHRFVTCVRREWLDKEGDKLPVR